MKAISINSATQTVRVVEYNGLSDLQRLVGGSIEVAYQWPNGDVLYVDEEGLLKPQEHFFLLAERSDQPLAGDGVIVGAEQETEAGYVTLPPTFTVPEVLAKLRFLTRSQVDSWAKANASDAAIVIGGSGPDGWSEAVVARIGRLFANIPRKD